MRFISANFDPQVEGYTVTFEEDGCPAETVRVSEKEWRIYHAAIHYGRRSFLSDLKKLLDIR